MSPSLPDPSGFVSIYKALLNCENKVDLVGCLCTVQSVSEVTQAGRVTSWVSLVDDREQPPSSLGLVLMEHMYST